MHDMVDFLVFYTTSFRINFLNSRVKIFEDYTKIITLLIWTDELVERKRDS